MRVIMRLKPTEKVWLSGQGHGFYIQTNLGPNIDLDPYKCHDSGRSHITLLRPGLCIWGKKVSWDNCNCISFPLFTTNVVI